VAAVGITHFAQMPDELADLSPALASHSSAHHDLSAFAGRDVTVIGGGSSAVDIAALLHEAGATASLVARCDTLRFFSPPSPRPRGRWQRVLHPSSGLGPGWRSWLCENAPRLFRFLPGDARLTIIRRHLGPKSAWAMKARLEAGVSVRLGTSIERASEEDGRVRLVLQAADGTQHEVLTDHVVAATGYSPDGYTWSKPTVLFPPYKIPDGTTKEGHPGVAKDLFAVMHQRMGFYTSKHRRLLALGFYGICLDPHDDPNDGKGIGRVVREIHTDGSFGPIYFIHYNPAWNEKNTSYPFYTSSKDKGFVDDCNELMATPLVIVLVVVETTDLLFAVDSIPSILAITRDAFIVYTSNVFAILGLRSMYFALAGMMEMFRYLHYGLSVVLMFVGAKMLLSHYYEIPTAIALSAVAGILLLSVAASMLKPKAS